MAEYVYFNGQPLAKLEGANTYNYHNDHLATPQKMTDSSGQVVWSADYKPFGEATVTVSTITNNLRFPGQYYDAETGLNYNYYRDYNPVIGRYVESDPIGILQGNNHLFTYTQNNPINAEDSYGLSYLPPEYQIYDPSTWPYTIPRTTQPCLKCDWGALGLCFASKMGPDGVVACTDCTKDLAKAKSLKDAAWIFATSGACRTCAIKFPVAAASCISSSCKTGQLDDCGRCK